MLAQFVAGNLDPQTSDPSGGAVAFLQLPLRITRTTFTYSCAPLARPAFRHSTGRYRLPKISIGCDIVGHTKVFPFLANCFDDRGEIFCAPVL